MVLDYIFINDYLQIVHMRGSSIQYFNTLVKSILDVLLCQSVQY